MPIIGDLVDQIDRERRLVSFDSYDLTVRQLLEMYSSGEIFVPPEYQRQFVWGEERQSELVESVLLGIPIPNLFMAANKDGSWEVVDGVQRLSSIAHFLGSEVLLERVGKKEPLRIRGLRKLSHMNGMKFDELPKTMQFMFSTRPLRVTVLNDKSDLEVRYDLFERLNTGGVSLTNQEIRNSVFRGPFNDSIKRLAENVDFKSVVKLKPVDQANGTKEELVLRFFAFLDAYRNFEHSVEGFLNDYMREHIAAAIPLAKQRLFQDVFAILRNNLPDGLVRGGRGVTPVNLYEAIAVGSALAIQINQPQALHFDRLPALTIDDELKRLTTGATNSRRRVTGRIEYVRDALL